MSTMFNHQIAFIHIPKCAGLSVEQYLKRTCPAMKSTKYRHVPLSNMAKSIDIGFKMVLAVVRNPYEQQVSQWQFWREEYERGKQAIEFTFAYQTPFKMWVDDPRSNFGCKGEYGRGVYWWWLQVNGEVPANVVLLKLEDLHQLPALTMPYRVLDADMPHLNTSKHEDWQQYYDDDTKAKVQRKFNWIFERGVYER